MLGAVLHLVLQDDRFGGTTQVAERAPDQMLGRQLTIRFDSNVAPGCRGRFAPEQNEIKVRLGEVATVHYRWSTKPPRDHRAGRLQRVAAAGRVVLHQINCFCFTQQTMKPGETREMTVVFYVDPEIAKTTTRRLNTITLSYTSTGSASSRCRGADANKSKL